MSDVLAIVAPHLYRFPGGRHCNSFACNLVDVCWTRESVDVEVCHNRLSVIDAEIRGMETRHLYELVVVGESLQ